MQQTNNYGLNKPESTDFYNVDDFNSNMDVIDTKLMEAENAGTASKNHIEDTENPHNVTKAQVGLSNVPNVATNNQTPTYTVPSDVAELESGEKLSTAFGKIAKFIKHTISKFTSIDDELDNRMPTKMIQPSVTDMNELTTVGFYTIYAPTNAPNSNAAWWNVIVMSSNNNPTYINQIVMHAYSTRTYTRYRVNDTWSTWTWTTLNADTPHLLLASGNVTITSGADLNSITTVGKYYTSTSAIAQTVTNRPSTLTDAFCLIVEETLTGEFIKQHIIGMYGGDFYRYYRGSSGWSDWVQVVTSNRFATITTSSITLDSDTTSGSLTISELPTGFTSSNSVIVSVMYSGGTIWKTSDYDAAYTVGATLHGGGLWVNFHKPSGSSWSTYAKITLMRTDM